MSRLSIRHMGNDGYHDDLMIGLTGRFAGVAEIYDRLDGLIESADRLAVYPLDPRDPPSFEHPGATFRLCPVDAVGRLELSVRLVDHADPEILVSVKLPMTYQGVRNLEQALRAFAAAPDQTLDVEIG